jgi:fructan beta-fructosidase
MPWRGQRSFPRALKLRKTRAGIRLVQETVAELQSLRRRHEQIENQSAEAANGLLQSENVNGETLEIEAEIDSGSATEFGFKVRKGSSEETLIGVDRAWARSSGPRPCASQLG